MARRFRIGRRGGLVLAFLAVAACGWGVLYWYFMRLALRNEVNYYRESSALRQGLADRLEAALPAASGDGPGREEAVEKIYELLRSTPVGGSEVAAWRLAPPSPERNAAAVKWARAAAEEEAWQAIMDARAADEIGRGRIPIQFSADDVAAFRREARARKARAPVPCAIRDAL